MECNMGTLTLEEAVGVAGAEGREAQLWALCDADEDERVGEAVRDEGLDRRPRDRKAARPCVAPSGRMNFSRSSRLVRPRAAEDERRRNEISCLAVRDDDQGESSVSGESQHFLRQTALTQCRQRDCLPILKAVSARGGHDAGG